MLLFANDEVKRKGLSARCLGYEISMRLKRLAVSKERVFVSYT